MDSSKKFGLYSTYLLCQLYPTYSSGTTLHIKPTEQDVIRHERDYLSRRQRNTIIPVDKSDEQTAFTDIRQTDGILSTVHPYAGRD